MIFQPQQFFRSSLLTEAIVARTSLLTPLKEITTFQSKIAIIFLRIIVAIALEVATTFDLLRWTFKTFWCWDKEHLTHVIAILAAFILNLGMVVGYRLKTRPNQALQVNTPRIWNLSLSPEPVPEKSAEIINHSALHQYQSLRLEWLNNDEVSSFIANDKILQYLICRITNTIPDESVPEKIAEIINYPPFHQYQLLRLEWLNNTKVSNLIANDEILQHLVCPITNTIPEFPVCIVKARLVSSSIIRYVYSRTTFEYSAIAQWLKDHPTEIYPNPEFEKAFTLNDFRFDIPYLNGIQERLRSIYLKTLDNSPSTIVKNNLNIFFIENISNLIHSYITTTHDNYNPFEYQSQLLGEIRNLQGNSITYRYLGNSNSNKYIKEKAALTEYANELFALKVFALKTKRIRLSNKGFWDTLLNRSRQFIILSH